MTTGASLLLPQSLSAPHPQSTLAAREAQPAEKPHGQQPRKSRILGSCFS